MKQAQVNAASQLCARQHRTLTRLEQPASFACGLIFHAYISCCIHDSSTRVCTVKLWWGEVIPREIHSFLHARATSRRVNTDIEADLDIDKHLIDARYFLTRPLEWQFCLSVCSNRNACSNWALTPR